MSEPDLGPGRVREVADRLPAGVRELVVGEARALSAFLEHVWRANAGVNLVSRRTTAEELLRRHLLESARGLAFLPAPSGAPLRLLDIGSGGGFPALPILLVRRDVTGVLVESVSKKARFLAETAEALGLTLRVVGARFPDPSMKSLAPFDILTSRAVADAGRLLRQAQPWMSSRGRALLWTTEPLFGEVASRFHRAVFHGDPGAERRGIAVIECST